MRRRGAPHPGLAADRWPGVALALILMVVMPVTEAQGDRVGEASHLMLAARLDRPEDGYCLDVLGTGSSLRPEQPLFAHNCKPALTTDSAVVMTAEGMLYLPGPGRCVTVAGVNGRALPGAALLLRPCGEQVSFFQAAALQRFRLQGDARLRLADSGLCVAVGDRSASTYSQDDRWRTLFMVDCDTASPERSRWRLVVPD